MSIRGCMYFINCIKFIVLIINLFIYICRYNTKYEGKHTITYWYVCSQRVNLVRQSRKYHDPSKQCDTSSMNRFDCEGYF